MDRTAKKLPEECPFDSWAANSSARISGAVGKLNEVEEWHARNLDDSHTYSTGRQAKMLISWLAPLSAEELPLSREFSLITKAVASILEAVEEEVITKDEAEAVTRFLLEKFVQRKFDKTLDEVFKPAGSSGFLASSHHYSRE